MSGGSFNYLCYADAGDLFQKRDSLREMADALTGLGHQAKDVATRTRALLALEDHITAEIEALSEVWRAVEWWRSCDTSREDVFVALGVYRERQR